LTILHYNVNHVEIVFSNDVPKCGVDHSITTPFNLWDLPLAIAFGALCSSFSKIGVNNMSFITSMNLLGIAPKILDLNVHYSCDSSNVLYNFW